MSAGAKEIFLNAISVRYFQRSLSEASNRDLKLGILVDEMMPRNAAKSSADGRPAGFQRLTHIRKNCGEGQIPALIGHQMPGPIGQICSSERSRRFDDCRAGTGMDCRIAERAHLRVQRSVRHLSPACEAWHLLFGGGLEAAHQEMELFALNHDMGSNHFRGGVRVAPFECGNDRFVLGHRLLEPAAQTEL